MTRVKIHVPCYVLLWSGEEVMSGNSLGKRFTLVCAWVV